MNLFAITSFLTSICSFLLALFIYFRRSTAKINKIWILVSLAVGFWSFGLGGVVSFGSKNLALFSQYILDVSAIFIPILFLDFVINLLNLKIKNKLLLTTGYIFAFLLAILSFTPLFKKGVEPTISFHYWISPGPIYFLFPLFFLSCALISFYIILKNYKYLVGIKKQQVKYVLLTAVIGFGGGLTNFLPQFSNIYPFGNFLVIFYIFSITYAIVKHRLMDIKVVLRKGVVYGLSIIIALAFYTYLAILLKNYLQNTLNLQENWGIFVLILLVALGFPPLKSLVERSINTLFKGKKSIDLAVKEVQEKIASKTEVDGLVDLISQEIRKFLGLEEVEILLINRQEKKFAGQEKSLDFSQPIVKYLQEKGEIVVREEIPHLLEADHEFDYKALKEVENKMSKLNIAVAIPVGKGEELIGLILLGKKKYKEAFTVEDIKFLERLSGQALFSLGNAVLYRDAMARVTETYLKNV